MKTLGAANNLNYSRYLGNTPLYQQMEVEDGVVYAENALAVGGYVILNESFRPSPQQTPNMTVRVAAGSIQSGTTITSVAAQNTSAISAPVGNPRNDIVYIDAASGAVGVATGTPAVTPTDPALPAGKIAIARVRLQTTTTAIDYTLMDDLRFSVGNSAGYRAVSVTTTILPSDNIVNFTTAGVDADLPAVATVPAGFQVTLMNTASSGDVTIDPDGAETIDGLASRVVRPGDRVTLISTGSAWITFRGTYSFKSTPQAIALNTAYSLAHGLGQIPSRLRWMARAKNAVSGWAIGDEVEVLATNATYGRALAADVTNVYCTNNPLYWYGSAGKASAAVVELNSTNWEFVLYAYVDF